jgi:hypothetical protein
MNWKAKKTPEGVVSTDYFGSPLMADSTSGLPGHAVPTNGAASRRG